MPRGDRTGPSGMGPMTGRGAGYCAGYPTPGFANPWVGGFGWGGGGGGRGRGRGRGFRGGYYGFGFPGQMGFGYPGYMPGPSYPYYGQAPYGQAPRPEDEMEFLRDQAEGLKEQLDEIDKRIQELEAEAKTKK